MTQLTGPIGTGNGVMPFTMELELLLTRLDRGIDDGELTATKGLVFCKKLEETLEFFTKKIKEKAEAEFEKMNKAELEELPYGASVRRTERKTYEYSANEKYAELSTKLKAFESLLKVATDKNTAIVDPESGETIEAVPVKTKTIYALSLKQQ